MDEKILASPVKVKRFLEQQGIVYDPATPDGTLRGRAKARMKRIAEEGISPEEKRAKFQNGGEGALSVQALNEIIEAMNVAKKPDKKHYRVNFTIDDMSTNNVVVRKHEVGWPVKCNGFVTNGKCYKCEESVPGIETYPFKAIIADLTDATKKVIVNCAAGAGNSMFGVSPAAFESLADEAKHGKIEEVMFVPLNAGVVLEYKKDSAYAPQSCLEIGANAFPALPRHNANVYFADHVDCSGLIAKYSTQGFRRADCTPNMLVLSDGVTLSSLVGGRKLSLIVASHVVEHVPNLIAWLQDLAAVLDDGGVIRLAVPDARWEFDFRKRLTEHADVLGAYLENRTRPSPDAVYHHHIYQDAGDGDPFKIWQGHRPSDWKGQIAARHELAASLAAKARTEYVDVHVWGWTPETFVEQMLWLRFSNLIPLQVRPGSVVPSFKSISNEFFLELEKVDVPSHSAGSSRDVAKGAAKSNRKARPLPWGSRQGGTSKRGR